MQFAGLLIVTNRIPAKTLAIAPARFISFSSLLKISFSACLLRWLFAWMTAFPLQVQVVLPSLCFASVRQLLQIGLRSAAHA